MKKAIYLIIATSLFHYPAEGRSSRYDYDSGYEAAWEGEDEPSRFSSKEYRAGYEEGLDDAYMYDEGYNDAYDGKRPKQSDDCNYMEGFHDGEED